MLIALPIGYRLSMREVSLRERFVLVALFGLSLYAVKVIRDPFLFTFPDEPIHTYNADQVALHHGLFNGNPILPVTSGYPGLANATSALMSLTGMSSFGAGIFLIGLARLLLVFSLFVLFVRVSGSHRVAGLAVAIYAGSSNFLFWGVQYSYESLSLPLLVAVLAAFAEREAAGSKRLRAWAVPILLGTAAIVVTHHLTSYALVTILVGLSLIYRVYKLPRPNPWPFALFAAVLAVGWLLIAASSTVGYLSPVLSEAFTSVVHTVSGESAPRSLFQSASSEVVAETPPLARLVTLAAVALLGLGYLAGVRPLWRRRKARPFALLFCIGATAFFATLALRFAPKAWETGNRASEFLFIGLALIVATAGLRLLRRGPGQRARRAVFVAALGVIVVGGAIAGWPWDSQLAQPTRITAAGKEIESEPIALARWIGKYLPRGKFAAADADARLILAPGGARAKTGDALAIGTILSEESLGGWELPLLHGHGVNYIVADRRMVATDVVRGEFFTVRGSEEEPLLPVATMHKFAEVPLGRVYDSGSIVIYGLGDRP
jgi:MFS family permease